MIIDIYIEDPTSKLLTPRIHFVAGSQFTFIQVSPLGPDGTSEEYPASRTDAHYSRIIHISANLYLIFDLRYSEPEKRTLYFIIVLGSEHMILPFSVSGISNPVKIQVSTLHIFTLLSIY